MTQASGLIRGADIERIATGATWSEGPLWLPSRRALRWSDIPGNRILEWDAGTGATRVHRTAVEFTNGRALLNSTDAGDTVVQCSHGRRAIEVEHPDGTVEPLIDRFGDKRLNSPNDVAVHPDGSIWFTDPPYGLTQPGEGYPGEQEYGGCYVFRFADGILTPQITDVLRPNGLAFSPDGTTLYVADSSAAVGDGPDHCIRSYRLDLGAAAVGDGVHLADISPGVPDGIAVDVEGRIWSSAEDGVHILAADGTELAVVPVPEKVGNLCFGGDEYRTLFIAASTSIYRLDTDTVGLPC